MNAWRPYPLVRLVMPLITGIILELWLDPGAGFHLAVAGGLVFLILAARLVPILFPSFGWRWLAGIFIHLFLFTAGFELSRLLHIPNHPDYLAGMDEGELLLAGITEPPAETRYGYKTVLHLHATHSGNGWKRSEGLVLAYLKPGRKGKMPQFGDIIWLKARLDSITDNSNPHSFNYAKYLKNKGITHRVYASPWEWATAPVENQRFIRKFAFETRDRLLELLEENRVEGSEFAVAAALLLGYTGDLTPELMNDYSASGAMHVLSVSGMHVGIIYLFFEFLFGFMNNRQWTRWVKSVILLAFIWFYACMTGLAPCVFRSAAMLSLPILARSIDRHADMFNVIAASIFLMLVMEPRVILDVGFQLSYLAVIGLVVLYKPIYDLYITSAWLPDKIWSLLAVSVAAQIATFPITLYIFHQFPNYFLLTNLVVVPLSSLVIYCGILLMALGMYALPGLILGKCLSFLIWLMNVIIHGIRELPYSTWSGIHLTFSQMIILSLLILFMALYFIHRRILWFFISLILCNIFVVALLIQKMEQKASRRFTVYHVRQMTLFHFSGGNRADIFYGNGKPDDLFRLKRNERIIRDDMEANGADHLRHYWLNERKGSMVSAIGHTGWHCTGGFFLFCGKRFMVLDTRIPARLKDGIRIDYIICAAGSHRNPERIREVFHPEIVIMDGSNPAYVVRKWVRDAARMNMKIHATQSDGAFIKEF